MYASLSGSAHGYDACMVHWANGALRRICRQKQGETSFSFQGFSVKSKFQGSILGSYLLASLDWEGKAPWAGPPGVDFLAVVEHGLIPARVRSEWARLKCKGLASIWAPACQDASHVGNAGVGVHLLLCLPLPLLSFKRFFDCGRAG